MLPRFTENQLIKLADIASNIGLVALASVAIPAILDRPDTHAFIIGLASALSFWLISLWLIKLT